jgi:hypothetical protein
MNFKLRSLPVYRERVVTKFLWLPLSLKNKTKWLRRVSIRQYYVSYKPEVYGGDAAVAWKNDIFIN